MVLKLSEAVALNFYSNMNIKVFAPKLLFKESDGKLILTESEPA